MKGKTHLQALIEQYLDLYSKFRELIHHDEKFSETKVIYIAMKSVHVQLADEAKEESIKDSPPLIEVENTLNSKYAGKKNGKN